MKPKNYLVCAIAFLWLWSGIQPALFALPQSLDLLAQVGVQAAYRVPLFALSGMEGRLFAVLRLTAMPHCPPHTTIVAFDHSTRNFS